MTSQVKIYKTALSPERNLAIDDIETYLGGLTPMYTLSDFQYLRVSLDFELKFNVSQEYVDPFETWNYVRIVQNTKIYYAFITNKTQVASNTIKLTLKLDTINTFKYGVNIHPTNRTKVLREHKDRFTLIESSSDSFEETMTNTLISEDRKVWTYTYDFTGWIEENWIEDFSYDLYDVSEDEWESVSITFFKRPTIPKKTRITIVFTLKVSIPEEEEDPYCVIYGTLHRYELAPKIDLYSEGLTPVLYKRELGTMNQYFPYSWNLIYRNSEIDSESQNNVVDCFCCPDYSIPVKYNSAGEITYSELNDGKGYWISGSFLKNYYASKTYPRIKILNDKDLTISFKDNNNNLHEFSTYAVSTGTGFDVECTDIRGFVVSRIGTQLDISIIDIQARGSIDGTIYADYPKVMLVMTFTNVSNIKINDMPSPLYAYEFSSFSPNVIFESTNFNITDEDYDVFDLKGIVDIDRVDPQLIKIIKCPYSPFPYNVDTEDLDLLLPDGWINDGGYGTLRLLDLNTKFENKIISDVNNPIIDDLKYKDATLPNTETERNMAYETKLLHSDYYRPKFIYDSFGFVFKLEEIDIPNFHEYAEGLSEDLFEFTFVMTSTINSKWLFKFDWYKLMHSTEDYDNVLPVARNNEVVIYNSSYITYLRTAYRYDLKTLERNRQNTITGMVVGGIGSIASVGLGIASGNPAVMVSSGIHAGTSLANSLITNLNSLAQQEQTIEAKRVSLQNQAVSTSGSDDLDLLESYSDNKAKLVIYEVSPKLKQALYDLFYFTGYISNEIKIPQVNTRKYFNFLSCELELNPDDKANIPQIMLMDLLARYQDGVIFLHKVNGAWNFALDKENWETSLIN